MRKNLSKKQITAMGLTAIMAVQTSVMAAEVVTSPEITVQEITQEQPEEAAEVQTEKIVESQTEEVENVTQAQPDESVEVKTSESANQEESQSEEIQSTEVIETEPSETEISSEQAAVEYAAENQEVLTDGWHKDNDGNFSYVKDGQIVENKVIEIDGKHYGFDYRGILYVNTNFYMYDTDGVEHYEYRAKEDGSLYENEWYRDSYDPYYWYYYGEDGKAYTGLHTINGKQYYFSEYYVLSTNCIIRDGDDKIYYCDSDGVVTDVTDDGWVQNEGKKYYVKFGDFLRNCVEQIDGKYYGFDYNGILYVNEAFNTSYSDGTSYSYRAKEDGSLYVNVWYTDSYNWYYYGEDGKAYTGIHTINGKQYYFDRYGWLYKNGIIRDNDKTYYCDEEGIATDVTGGGWVQKDGNWLYIKDGVFLTNCVVKIGDNYYGFDYDRSMYVDEEFDVWDSESGEYKYYRAGGNGVLYTNKWISGENGVNYYGEDAKRCTGLQTINGIQYFFDSEGILIVSQAIVLDGVNYYCDANGIVHEMPNNQWYQSDSGDWYFVQDGIVLKDCTTQIAGKWYRFDYNGKLNTKALNTDESGAIRVNTWYYDGSHWSYYGGNAEEYRCGVYEISGVKYYFDNFCYMTVSDVCTDGVNVYMADASGRLTKITKDGWIQAGGKYYYIENGKLVTSKAYKINGSWYAFNYAGEMYVNTNVYYRYEDGSENYYRAKADGSLYCSEWYQDFNQNWYYYDENAKMARGTTKIGKTIYEFDNEGILAANGAVLMGTTYRLADQNGIWVETPGWALVAGNWYYVLADGSLYTGILEKNGVTYYLTPKMVKNVSLVEVDGVAYQIVENGVATKVTDGFYQKDTSNHLYYVSNGKTWGIGWLNEDGNWYYFAETDETGLYYAVTGTNETIGGKLYHFNLDGTMASQGWGLHEDGSWYYAYASGELATGDVTIGGTAYHFDENGKMQSGVVVEDGICKLYSEDGALLETGKSQGWSLLDGNYYYLSGGAILKDVSRCLLDGNWYGFDITGKMRVNTIVDGRFYGSSGAAQTGWFKIDGSWYYASPVTALLYKGFHVMNGVTYYFDQNGVMQIGEFVVDRKLFTTDASGAVISKKKPQDGWTSYNGNWYYYKDGTAYIGFVGDYYVILGELIHNEIVLWNGKSYYIGEDGRYLANTWCNNGASYATENGTLICDGWRKIDGKQYYFGAGGVTASYDLQDKNGVYTKDRAYLSPNGYAQGWALIDGIYYYKEGNQFVKNQVKKINGEWYLFDVHGSMVTGFSSPETFGYDTYTYDGGKFYYGADGKRVYYTGWQVIDGNWYYFNSKSEAVDGWNIINGAKYYFGKTNHFMYTGYKVISGELYYFNASGACQGVDNTFTGWHQQDGKWYYIKNGQAATGTIYVNGTLYEFDANGVWICN